MERDTNGKLVSYAWPGGYPVWYITKDSLTICPDCANKVDTSDPPIACDVNWEDSELFCDDCGKRIESAYAEDEVTA